MDYAEWVSTRISELRTQRGISARDMSLSLGQSESYINKIENHRTLPSLTGLFYICEYLGITPEEFFRVEDNSPEKSKKLMAEFARLKPEFADHVLQLVTDLNSLQ